MLIGILGVLKAGGAYLPIDCAYPQDRIDYLLEDTKTPFVLSQKCHNKTVSIELPFDKVIYIDLTENFYQQEKVNNLSLKNLSMNLAYIIYTSGTTGKPKGVMINHASIVNKIEWMQLMYPLSSEDVVLQKTPFVFDVSVWELLWANWYCATIVFAKPGGHKESKYLDQLIQVKKVSVLHFVPSMLDVFNHYLLSENKKFHSSIRHLFCCGEELSKRLVQQTIIYKCGLNICPLFCCKSTF